jgi:hypothetical protein
MIEIPSLVNLHSVRGGKVESGNCGLIVGALYENEFVKEDGRWRKREP